MSDPGSQDPLVIGSSVDNRKFRNNQYICNGIRDFNGFSKCTRNQLNIKMATSIGLIMKGLLSKKTIHINNSFLHAN